jgi:hypothetical protein
MSEKKTEKITLAHKLGGIALGAVALLLVIKLVEIIRKRREAAAAVGGMSALENTDDVVAAEQAAKGAGLSEPCVAGTLYGTPASDRQFGSDLFPGSYVAYAYMNAGCEPNPRNKRC